MTKTYIITVLKKYHDTTEMNIVSNFIDVSSTTERDRWNKKEKNFVNEKYQKAIQLY